MSIERINPSDIYQPNRGIYTQVIKATGSTQVLLAGIVPFDLEQNIVGLGDMKTQVARFLKI